MFSPLVKTKDARTVEKQMTENENTFERFLQWEEADLDAIKVKRLYVDITGDIVAGLLLSQIIYWHLPSKRGKTKLQVLKEGQLWLAKGRADWWDECRISARQFDRAIEILAEKRIIEKRTFRFNGSPTVHIRLVSDQLLGYVNSILRNGENEITPPNDDLEVGFHESVNSISPIGDIHITKNVNSISPFGDVHVTKNVKTLTETTTETTTETSPPYPPCQLSRPVKTEDDEGALLSKPKPRRTKTQTEDTVPYSEIVEAYHLHCPSLPHVIKVTDARKKQIAARWKENSSISFFADLFQLIEKSDFLTNRGNINKNGWSCTFDWALNDQNMTKILEGRYSNKTIAPAQPQKEPQYSGWGHNVPDYVRQIAEMSARRS